MLYNMYESVHNGLSLHFWDLPTLVTAVALAVVLVVHVRNQKKREDGFGENRKEEQQKLGRKAKDAV